MKAKKSQLHKNFYFNAELVAPNELQSLVIKLQKSLDFQEDVDYLPGEKCCPVHLTLYSTYSSRSAINNMIKNLKKIGKRFKPISIKINGIDCFNDGSIYLKCEKTAGLIMLHREIATNLNLLRDIKEPPPEFAIELTKEQIEKFKEVGDPFALENFKPHVTIAKVSNYNKAINLSKNLPQIKVKMTFYKIAARIWESENSMATMLFELILK